MSKTKVEMTETKKTLEENQKLTNKIEKKLKSTIDYKQIVNLLPKYSKEDIISELKLEDISLDLTVLSLLDFRKRNPGEECKYTVPVFIPITIKEEAFFKLINLLYHPSEEQSFQLAQILSEQFGSDNGLIFDYFVNVGFPNIFQHFLSINNCESASVIINSLISIAKDNPQAIKLATNLISSFILNCYPFIQEFRQNFTDHTLFEGMNDIDDYTEAFLNSFSNSLLYLTKHHISVLKTFFNELSGSQQNLIDILFDGIFENVRRMNQFIFKSLDVVKENATDSMLSKIDEFLSNDESGYNYPNFEEDLFYKETIRFIITRADIYVLSKINSKIKDHSDLYSTNYVVKPEQLTMDEAFSISFRDRKLETSPEKQTKPPLTFEVDKANLNKWEAKKDQASIKGFNPISLLDLRTKDATSCLDVYLKEIEHNTDIENDLRIRMRSVLYLNQIHPLILQLLRESFLSYAEYDLEKNPDITPQNKWKNYALTFLNQNINRYLKDTQSRALTDKGLKKINDFAMGYDDNFNIFIQYFTQFQTAIYTPALTKGNDSSIKLPQKNKIQEAADDNKSNKYKTMFLWLKTLIQYEELFKFDSIESKTDENIKFESTENDEIIKPYLRLSNLIKYANEGLFDDAEKAQKAEDAKSFLKRRTPHFSPKAIAYFVVYLDEIWEEILSLRDNDEITANGGDDDDDDANFNGNFPMDDDDDVSDNIDPIDILFSEQKPQFSNMLKIMEAISKQTHHIIPPKLIESVNQMKEIFTSKKI